MHYKAILILTSTGMGARYYILIHLKVERSTRQVRSGKSISALSQAEFCTCHFCGRVAFLMIIQSESEISFNFKVDL